MFFKRMMMMYIKAKTVKKKIFHWCNQYLTTYMEIILSFQSQIPRSCNVSLQYSEGQLSANDRFLFFADN